MVVLCNNPGKFPAVDHWACVMDWRRVRLFRAEPIARLDTIATQELADRHGPFACRLNAARRQNPVRRCHEQSLAGRLDDGAGLRLRIGG